MESLFSRLVPAIRWALTLRHAPGIDAQTAASPPPLVRYYAVYQTRNTEYHVWRGVCVATRSLQPSEPADDHHGAVNMRMEGCILPATREPRPVAAKVGYRIAFASENRSLITSPIVSVCFPKIESAEEDRYGERQRT